MERQRKWKLKVRLRRKLELKEIKVIKKSSNVEKRSKVKEHAETLQLSTKPCFILLQDHLPACMRERERQ